MLCCKQGSESACNAVIRKGADLDLQDSSGKTALFHACRDGYHGICSLLIKAKASINIKDKNMRTALMEACLESYEVIAEELIQAGADLNMTDKNGNRAADLACGRTEFKNYIWHETYWRRRKDFMMFLYQSGFRCSQPAYAIAMSPTQISSRSDQDQHHRLTSVYFVFHNSDLCRSIALYM